ncbi:MAG: hypothetical protein QOC63_3729 [Mycobacterium sp.]|jgi:hypothetical protein|nr:hypothetical protein [Mycobacterium sp.]
MTEEPIAVDMVATADYTHTLSSISAELDNVVNSANSILAGVAEYFHTTNASVAFNDVHRMLMQGIDEGKDTILRHGHVLGQSVDHFHGTDMAAGQSFTSI